MKKLYLIYYFIFVGLSYAMPQDIMVMRNGDEVEAKVLEIGTEEIKYKKYSLLDGPDYLCLKSDVFMIKFENGTKEVFNSDVTSPEREVISTSLDYATLYFIRPKKFSTSAPEIIVGTIVPDEVVLKLKNGRWHKMKYSNIGSIDFVVGIYTINPEIFTVEINPGETYYFYCEPLAKGLKVMADMKILDKESGEKHISQLKEQIDTLKD